MDLIRKKFDELNSEIGLKIMDLRTKRSMIYLVEMKKD